MKRTKYKPVLDSLDAFNNEQYHYIRLLFEHNFDYNPETGDCKTKHDPLEIPEEIAAFDPANRKRKRENVSIEEKGLFCKAKRSMETCEKSFSHRYKSVLDKIAKIDNRCNYEKKIFQQLFKLSGVTGWIYRFMIIYKFQPDKPLEEAIEKALSLPTCEFCLNSGTNVLYFRSKLYCKSCLFKDFNAKFNEKHEHFCNKIESIKTPETNNTEENTDDYSDSSDSDDDF